MYLLKKKTALSVFTFSFLVLFAFNIKANPGGFTDKEITGFAQAVTQVMNIQQQGQMLMIEEIENHDMEIQRFNHLYMQMQQMPLEEVDGTDEEKEAMAVISEEIEKIQRSLESDIISAIEDEGLSIEKYEEIMTEYQQNPELQQRIQQEMQ